MSHASLWGGLCPVHGSLADRVRGPPESPLLAGSWYLLSSYNRTLNPKPLNPKP